MNFWIPNFSDWNDGFDPAGMPWYARYDYVEYWEYVPEAEWPTTSGANQWHPFKFGWRDDFDTFDTTRWTASEDWTFPVNDVTFWSSQVYAEDGALVLKLEPTDTTGDNDGSNDNSNDNSNSSGCGCEELLATINLLREQLAAF